MWGNEYRGEAAKPEKKKRMIENHTTSQCSCCCHHIVFCCNHKNYYVVENSVSNSTYLTGKWHLLLQYQKLNDMNSISGHKMSKVDNPELKTHPCLSMLPRVPEVDWPSGPTRLLLMPLAAGEVHEGVLIPKGGTKTVTMVIPWTILPARIEM